MYHLVSTIFGKIQVVHCNADLNNNLVFHGRYNRLVDALERAEQLNKRKGL